MSEHGNNAAMRKVLLATKGNFDSMGANALEGELNLDAVAMVCASMSTRIHAILSEPPRNCDRFGDELDAQLAFLNEEWLISVDRDSMLEKDRFENWTDEMRSAYARWLMATSKGDDHAKND